MVPLVSAQSLVKAYGSNVAVRDFSLTIADGEVVALLGGAGAGKSTVLKMISADLRPDAGSAGVCGYDTVLQAGMVRPRVGVMLHEHFLEGGLSGRENLDEQAMLRFFTPAEAEQRIAELLPLVALGERIAARVSTYSADEWSRLELAACLIHRPQLLIVDDFLLTPLSTQERKDFLEIVEERHASTAIPAPLRSLPPRTPAPAGILPQWRARLLSRDSRLNSRSSLYLHQGSDRSSGWY